MLRNPVQFAVVREDADIEAQIVAETRARRVLLVASGGCTALSLQALFPELEISLFDFNSAQLALVRKKAELLQEGNLEEVRRLNQNGNFESLFRQLRRFINEFIAPDERVREAFEKRELPALLEQMRGNKYWPVAFELFFSDSILNAMFGPDATQHAPRGSYPAYFQLAFERELGLARAARNPFLQHILLDGYREDSLPWYLQRPVPPAYRFELIEGTLDRVPDLGRYDLIALSNLFDWSPRAEIARIATRVRKEAAPGAVVLFRQLNHTADLQGLFAPEFQFDREREAELLARERSFFYSKLNLGTKRGQHG